jgi:hypothetical protein
LIARKRSYAMVTADLIRPRPLWPGSDPNPTLDSPWVHQTNFVRWVCTPRTTK